MSRRIEVELTSEREDGSWTWRAAGARQPRGVLDGSLLYQGAKAGDVVRADADFEVDGIFITAVLPPKAGGRREPERLEVIGPSRPQEGVTTSLVGRDRGRRVAGSVLDGPRHCPELDGPRSATVPRARVRDARQTGRRGQPAASVPAVSAGHDRMARRAARTRPPPREDPEEGSTTSAAARRAEVPDERRDARRARARKDGRPPLAVRESRPRAPPRRNGPGPAACLPHTFTVPRSWRAFHPSSDPSRNRFCAAGYRQCAKLSTRRTRPHASRALRRSRRVRSWCWPSSFFPG